MYTPDNVATIVLLTLWFILDAVVVMIDKEDSRATEYLTNQIWALAFIAKVALAFELYQNRNMPDGSSVSSITGWMTSLLFLMTGTAQFGVLGGFFLLTWLDCTLLASMLMNQVHTLSEVMVWNHARHVTVCFLHLSITWSMRRYLSNNARAVNDVQFMCISFQTHYSVFAVSVFVVPVSLGLLHTALFDDKKLYMFIDTSIGYRCQLAYATAALLASLYYILVPLRAVELERREPQGVESVTRPVFRIIGDNYETENPRIHDAHVLDGQTHMYHTNIPYVS
jgi:hypothetical protein